MSVHPLSHNQHDTTNEYVPSSSRGNTEPNKAIVAATGAILTAGSYIVLMRKFNPELASNVALISITGAYGAISAVSSRSTKALIALFGTTIGAISGVVLEYVRIGNYKALSETTLGRYLESPFEPSSSKLNKYATWGAIGGAYILTKTSTKIQQASQAFCGAAQKAWRLLRG